MAVCGHSVPGTAVLVRAFTDGIRVCRYTKQARFCYASKEPCLIRVFWIKLLFPENRVCAFGQFTLVLRSDGTYCCLHENPGLGCSCLCRIGIHNGKGKIRIFSCFQFLPLALGIAGSTCMSGIWCTVFYSGFVRERNKKLPELKVHACQFFGFVVQGCLYLERNGCHTNENPA